VTVFESDIERVLITEEQIQEKIRDLGAQITADYADKDLLLIGVLKGAFVLMADLSRHIKLPLEFDFMAVSSYGAATQTSGVVRILKDLDHEIAGRDVLLVEDIVDSGLTLNYLLKNLRTRKPASLEVCALLQKPEVQRVSIDVRYRGFEIPAVFVVGYGLDYDERYRNLPFVGTLRPEVYSHAAS
jgi:hypoxanthine phosphoribosyltransferase